MAKQKVIFAVIQKRISITKQNITNPENQKKIIHNKLNDDTTLLYIKFCNTYSYSSFLSLYIN